MHMVNIIIYTLDYVIKIIQVYATPKYVNNKKFCYIIYLLFYCYR